MNSNPNNIKTDTHVELELPLIPIIVVLILLIILLVFIYLKLISTWEISGTGANVIIIMGSVFVSFSLVYMMTDYYKEIDSASRFVTQFKKFASLINKYDPSLLPVIIEVGRRYVRSQNVNIFLPILSSLLKKVGDEGAREFVKISNTEIADAVFDRLNVTSMPIIIWYVVFVFMFFISYIAAIDTTMPEWLKISAIIVIWLPVFVMYYLIMNVGREIESMVEDAIKEIMSGKFVD